jgi:hypothetical protein
MQRVLRWHLYIEEYAPQFHYVKGADHIVAGCFSRMPSLADKRVVEQPNDSIVASLDDDLEAQHTCSILDDMACFDRFQLSDDAVECFVNFPADIPVNPIAYLRIQQLQAQHAPLMELVQHDPV